MSVDNLSDYIQQLVAMSPDKSHLLAEAFENTGSQKHVVDFGK